MKKKLPSLLILCLCCFLSSLILSCSDDGEKNESQGTSVYKDTDSTGLSYCYKFYSSEKWEFGSVISDNFIVSMKGTFSGNASKDGTLYLVITHMLTASGKLEQLESPLPMLETVSNGKIESSMQINGETITFYRQ